MTDRPDQVPVFEFRFSESSANERMSAYDFRHIATSASDWRRQAVNVPIAAPLPAKRS